MQKFFTSGLVATLLLTLGCNSTKPVVMAPPVETEMRQLDTMTVTPETNGVIYDEPEVEIANERPTYRPTYTRANDLLHTKLEVSFDWEQEMVIGVATLRLTPLFRPTSELTLDAKNFNFNSISLAGGKALSYNYEGEKQEVVIDLGREYQRGEEYTVVLDYTVIPAETGGSAAITSDKGLFFINPRGEDPEKPQQIWTQGETENNSRWFPTIDKPNERCTQEIYVTVANKYKTLSNGVLVNSQPAGEGKRTDYWKMDLPHAPYLFALIVGDFEVVEDEPWNGIPVNYYLEEKWSDYATDIFPYTGDMLTFFSDLTGVNYPWPKYSQVAVRDYVSGAMENTTAVIFGEFMHGTDRDLIDVDRNEKIVAHEMFHHWFGDYVTCESWSNLTLNEGFANYSEYLWMEEKHGKDAADYHLLEEWQGYLSSAQNSGVHELIWYDYEDKEQMFDAHSYNKGGSVLHMLRTYLGDETFFASLKKYLTDNQYSPVEVAELRMAFEEVSGEDLNWFFDQWFLSAGHPKLSISQEYADGKVRLTVQQTQDTDDNVPGVFRIPVNVDVYAGGNTTPTTHRIWIEEREQTFEFDAPAAPEVVIFDPEHQLLAEYDYEKSPEELTAQFRYGKSLLDRFSAVIRMSAMDDAAVRNPVLTAALEDDFYAVRGAALQALEAPTEEQKVLIRKLAGSEPNSQVRAVAISLLGAMGDAELVPIATEALDARAYPVVAAGLEALVAADPAAANAAAAKLETVENNAIISALASLYSAGGNLEKLPFFEDRLERVTGYDALNLYTAYQELLAAGNLEQQTAGAVRLKALAMDQEQNDWRRLSATKAISDLGKSLTEKVATMAEKEGLNKFIMELGVSLEAIKAAETDENLKNIYQQF